MYIIHSYLYNRPPPSPTQPTRNTTHSTMHTICKNTWKQHDESNCIHCNDIHSLLAVNLSITYTEKHIPAKNQTQTHTYALPTHQLSNEPKIIETIKYLEIMFHMAGAVISNLYYYFEKCTIVWLCCNHNRFHQFVLSANHVARSVDCSIISL